MTSIDNFNNKKYIYVTKRNNELEKIQFDKITRRINTLCTDLTIDPISIAIKVIDGIVPNIETKKLDILAAEICATNITHPDYLILAARITISNLHKETDSNYINVIKKLYNNNIISNDLYNTVINNKEIINNAINYDNDYNLTYFSIKTLERSYLMKINEKIIERPQHLWMRVALSIHADDINSAIETYNLLSNKMFIHATPTLFNSGTNRQQLSSCFLLDMQEDSIEGIYTTLKQCALISKYAGGIGLNVHSVRGNGSKIYSTNGYSNGLIPMLRVYDATARYVNQSSRRPGSIAIYIEPWHSDIYEVLECKKNRGKEEEKTRDLFYALWIPDIFMERVRDNKIWSLMCPATSKKLYDVYGNEFNNLYIKYENEGKYIKQINARDLWNKILDSQIETGSPYMLYKDSCNEKSNQKNLGTIKSSNLCVSGETLILTDKGHLEIQTLEGQKVNVWNGKEFSQVEIKKTNDKAELITIYFSDGMELTCTKYHKFYIRNNTRYYHSPSNDKLDIIKNLKYVDIVEAQNLKPGMKLVKCDFPIIDNNIELKYAYTNGFFSGDGTYTNIVKDQEEHKCNYKALPNKAYCKRHINYQIDDTISEMCSLRKIPYVALYGEKIKLLDHLDYISCGEENNKLNVKLNPNLEEKFFVPMNYSIKSKLEWFAGLCDADGTLVNFINGQSLQIASINKDFLKKIKLMLQKCGCNPKIILFQEKRTTLLPDEKNGHKEYNCKELYRLQICGTDLNKLINLGFICYRLLLNINKTNGSNRYITITKIENNNRIDSTYCFTEPKRNAAIFSGIFMSQCSEILEYTSKDEIAVCNLASIAVNNYIKEDKTFDYEKLHKVTKIITKNLNKVIDINYYPLEEAKRSNLKHRPIGIGIQGLADLFIILRYPFESFEARKLNRLIHETIYHGALEASCELAQIYGPYESYIDSPISKGILQYDMWDPEIWNDMFINNIPINERWNNLPSNLWNWDILKQHILQFGLRNSLLIALMPTATTAQILGNNESFEPYTSNLYVRRVLSGEYFIINKYLLNDLINLNLWNQNIINSIKSNMGSIQNIPFIPTYLKDIYKTVWEIPQKILIQMAIDRAPFIDQSQSLNIFMANLTKDKLTAMHFYGWQKGLKTGMYYLRTKPATIPIQITLDKQNIFKNSYEKECTMCQS